ncbi:MAG: sigma-54 dependent transcriptional regulator [Desulfomonilaceae bacterium]|nr:sigma-54 dependent transcriptional regulator [Desulfomonilaceae bacterium]
MAGGRILAIDDEQNIRRLIRDELGLEGFDVETASSGEEGLEKLSRQIFDVVLLDIKLPDLNGIEVLRRIGPKIPPPEVIMITGYGDIQTAVQSMKLGARDYITKPFKLSELLALIGQIMDENGKPAHLKSQRSDIHDEYDRGIVVFRSPKMQEIYGLVDKVASTDVTILIQGETGVGKDVLARRIYARSSRNDKPFVVVDCGLLSENLAESELYGHSKGAFSGAKQHKKGLVEEAEGGTIFFDEIGNIGLELQKKFLRFLETKKFRRLGETRERESDTRIILATNMNLTDAAQRGTLRKDLLYRMDVICLNIPPLRDHPEDVSHLADHFLSANVVGSGPMRLSREALDFLTAYPWPGNVRELRSVIVKAMIFAKSQLIRPDDLPSHVVGKKKCVQSDPKSLEDLEKDHIMSVLEETGGNQSKAAEILGINRKTLYKKIHKYHLLA